MSSLAPIVLRRLLPALILALAACGGKDAPPPSPSPNRLPLAVAGPDQTVNEGAIVTLDGSASSDPDGRIESFEWSQTSGPTVTLSGSDTATPGFTAPATTVALTLSFRLVVSDDGGAVATDEVQVRVNPVNEAPTAADDSASTDEDVPVSIDVLANDSDADDTAAENDPDELNPASVTVSDVTGGAATVDSATGRVRFLPAPNFSGSAGFKYTVSDIHGAVSQPAGVTVAVQPVNDAPAISDTADLAVDEDTAAGPIGFTIGDVETEAGALTVTAASDNEALIPASGITLAGNSAERTITLTPAANAHGTANITLTVSDGAASATDTFVLTVNSVNDVPVAQALSVSGREDHAITGRLAATDVDGDALSYALASPPANGVLELGAGGQFTYTPNLNFNGSDSFTFTARDGRADSAPATVRLSVSAEPEALASILGGALSESDADARTLDVEITLDRAPDGGSATVDYEVVDLSTRAGADYEVLESGTLTFGADSLSQTIAVRVVDDEADEPDAETFKVVLRNPSASAELGVAEALGQILDDDRSNLLLIGAARRDVRPAQKHIDGVPEARLAGAPRTQKFNLGGFGINPTQSLPNPADQIGEQLTQPAKLTVFTGSHGEEPIALRVMVMEQDGGERAAFVTLDAIGAGNLIQDGVKAAINLASCALNKCIAPENILFGQTHTHAGPDLQGLWGGVPEDWVQNILYRRAAEAVTEALESRRPARLTLAQGHTVEFNNYRRPRIDPGADADGTLTLLKAVGDDGTPVGSILQYNAHPTSINEKPRIPHADYIQGAMDWLETTATGPGGVALYYNGPIADASPSGSRPNCTRAPSDLKYGEVRCRGEGIAAAALRFTERELSPTLAVNERSAMLPITNPGFLAFGALGSFNRYYNFLQQVPISSIPGIGPEAKNLPQLTPAATTLVSRVTIGGAKSGLEIVTIPGEATNTFGQYIRSLAKTNVMLLGLTHNSFGYIIPEEEFSYVDQTGGDGLVAPFTGYEENVSLGPLTAPLLRTQAYNPLFEQPPEQNLPPTLSSCLESTDSSACILQLLDNRISTLLNGLEACAEGGLGAPGCPFRTTIEFFSPIFEALSDGFEAAARQCREFDGPEEFCGLFSQIGDAVGDAPNTGAGPDDELLLFAARTVTAGCDFLDPAHCLYPFPNDHFTIAAPSGSPQSRERGGTGKRVNFNRLAMPRNIFGKPVDPTEWNRNDGFSPGQMIVTYVPNLGTVKDADGKPLGPVTGAVPITDLSQYLRPDAPIFVLDADTGERHPVWAEIDLNAGFLLPMQGRGERAEKKPALLIRPAKNFTEGHRYIVVLRNLKDDAGRTLTPGVGFRVCRGDLPSRLRSQTPVKERCDHIRELIETVDGFESGFDPSELYLVWDFTVASAKNNVARLTHMRDDAFATLGEPADAPVPGEPGYPAGRAPAFTITRVTDFTPEENGNVARRIEGTFTVPSYVVPADPSAVDGNAGFRQLLNQFENRYPGVLGEVFAQFRQQCLENGGPKDFCNQFHPREGDVEDVPPLATSISLPPNRLFYNPADAANPGDPQGQLFGDGLPDRNPSGEMTTTFTCNIPRSAVSNKPSITEATPTDVKPARPSLYGHGLLGGQGEVNSGHVVNLGNLYGMMFCAADWFGFASGDAGNVVSTLVDLSNFPVVPDGSQQGMVNFLFLARLLTHPDGFVSRPEFQVQGVPVFDRREVFYDGNSQGGILGGVVVAASKDINRGVLGVPGMNYSTLLTRSTDFATYSVPLYLSYPDDLDRPFLISMMQMLWDRSENNGYAHHLTDNRAMGGPNNEVLLHPAFGDHQVTMWSVDVMARTIGARVDRTRVSPERHPDNDEFFGIETLDYSNPEHAAGSGLVYWDQPWDSQNDSRCDGKTTAPPPIGNVPPERHKLDLLVAEFGEPVTAPEINVGDDPHECPRREAAARCQKAHFLLRENVTPGDTAAALVDVSGIVRGTSDTTGCPAIVNTGAPGALTPAPGDKNGGLIALAADFMQAVGDFIQGALAGNLDAALRAVQDALDGLARNAVEWLIGANGSLLAALQNALANLQDQDVLGFFTDFLRDVGQIVGLQSDPVAAAQQSGGAVRQAEPVVLTGAAIPSWSVPAAVGVARPYPSGARQVPVDPVRSAHNGVLLYPPAGQPALPGVPVDQIAAYAYAEDGWREIPVQVDERMPYFLANANSSFSTYSGTDPELSYVWDTERWNPRDDTSGCRVAFDAPTSDPVPGLDNDDEIVFMAKDAGGRAPADSRPDDVPPDADAQEIVLLDPLDPAVQRYVYLFRKTDGSNFRTRSVYVNYTRDENADQWIDRLFFKPNQPENGTDPDPERIGTSNAGYGPNLTGTVCPDGTPATARASSDRFPRDGVTVTTDTYRWRASGRWMVREIRVAKPGQPGVYGGDLVDRWKGRAFQQSPDSTLSLVGFEDEQVNWEANSILLGERAGPVRAIREVWGADSGTNVTKTETFYRDAVSYRYRVRVHPIPPDGLYTSWDYNRAAMVPTPEEAAAGIEGGRYFTQLRPQGVPVDGINDDIGHVDSIAPVMTPDGPMCFSADDRGLIPPDANGQCPAFFDAADPTFNLLTGFYNWEQVSGKGDLGSLVYLFEIKGATSLTNPLVVPYYRDDACLDDGTGDDPVARPFPGESYRWNGGHVPRAYDVRAGRALDHSGRTFSDCLQRQGAHGSHGIHYFFTHDSDNAFTPVSSTEIDGQQWQFMVPTDRPQNVGEPYANLVRAPLQAVVTPRPPSGHPSPAPDYADVCASYGVNAADPGCGMLRQTEMALRAECESRGIPEASCTLLGGNLHALLDACYLNNPGENQVPACRVVDAFVGGAAAYCRQVSNASGGAQRPEFCALIGGALVSEEALQRHEQSWVHRALLLQNKLGHGLPLVHNSIVATHNSFNATDDNTPPTLSGSDYNQLYGIVDQLRMGVRAIEIDVHWAPGRDGSPQTFFREPMVCHGRDGGQGNAGCTTEKPLREVLAELRAWLDAHPDEAVVLYLEDDIAGTLPADQRALAYATTAQVVADEIGDLVYGPGWHGSACDNSNPATDPGSWLNVSRRQILAAGKQLLLYTETCAGGTWDTLFHRKTGDNVTQGTQESYEGRGYEPGADNCVFAAFRRRTWTRVWEDSTVVTAAAGGGAPAAITPEVARELMRCGLNMPSLDRLYPADGRLAAMVWSWAENEPASDDGRDCAAQGTDGRFFAAVCGETRPYACVSDTNPDQWTVSGSGPWDAAACPPGTHFGVPGNGYANEKLREAKLVAGVSEVWLNYSDAAAEGVWEGDAVGGSTPRVRASFRTEQGLMHAVSGFLSDMVASAGRLLAAQFEAFVSGAADAFARLITRISGVLVANDEAGLLSALERLIANLRALDTDNAARDFARDLVAVLNGGGAPPATGIVRAGVGVVDMTPDVGYCSGQYCDIASDRLEGAAGGDFDPYLTHKTKRKSDGVQSRLTARAIVVEGSNGKRIALLKTDNYLAQDMLLRRVGQILAEHDSSIGYPQILHHVTHNHTSAYSSTLSWGPWLFEDAYDARFFENQARKIADAILMAEADLRPARMGATTVRHTIYKGNVVRLATADDGTPAGYPLEYGDHGLVVMRFDDISDPQNPIPLAVWINWGEHPESLDGPNMHGADFIAALERWVDRETGAPLVFSQGDVGSAENSGDRAQVLDDRGVVCGRWPENAPEPEYNDCPAGEGVLRDWDHRGFVQTERNVRYLADAVIAAFHKIGRGDADVQVPYRSDFVVDYRNAWVPGPLSHPYPAISNCRAEPTYSGNPGSPLLGLPDCARARNGFGLPGEIPEIGGDVEDAYEQAYQQFIANGGGEAFGRLAQVIGTLEAEGIPVADHYDAYSHIGLEENNRLYLQAFRLGDVLLASCACEAQADLILNLESRTDTAVGNIYDGFDWACLMPEYAGEAAYAAACEIQRQYYDPAEFPTPVPGTEAAKNNPVLIAHLRAQVHNDARGWDAPEYAAQANSEPLAPADDPSDFSAIKGNFTKEEIQAFGVPGYRLTVGIGHAGDYNGYTVSYREYMNRDHYRKALTSYGPHTADYMVTRLVKMAAALQGGPELAPEPHDTLAQADETRQVALAQLHGQATASAYDAFYAALPPDLEPQIVAQPADITRFQAATFTWRGGSTAVDNPVVRVQRLVAGAWVDAYDMSGEVQTRVHWPQGIPETLPAYAGQFEWLWTANFEAYTAFPARLGSTPPGRYRFVVEGRVKRGQDFTGYRFESQPFTVSPWNGIAINNVSASVTGVTFTVPPIVYPRSDADAPEAFPYIRDDGNARICETCTFRPWAGRGRFEGAEVLVSRSRGGTEAVPASCTVSGGDAGCTANVVLLPGDTALVRAFDQDGNTGTASLP